MTTPSISVAMATFNGMQWFDQQLSSILGQTRLPVQVVIADDGSTDGTLELAESAAAQYGGMITVLRPAAAPLGPAQNFGRALARTTGELVALCDQDDVWSAEKLEVLGSHMRDPVVAAAFSDATVTDSTGQDLGSFWKHVAYRPNGPLALDDLLRRNPVSGATMLVRRSVVAAALPIPPGAIHDYWLTLIAMHFGVVVPIDAQLVRYRQHGRNAVGVPQQRRLRHGRRIDPPRWDDRSLFDAGADRLIRLGAPEDVVRSVRARARFAHRRADVRASVGLSRLEVIPMLLSGGYHRFARGMTSAARDAIGVERSSD